MTAQEIFDTVVAHLRKQRVQSKLGPGCACMYRGPAGRMCAVGVLIPDEAYDPCLEYNSVKNLLEPTNVHGDASGLLEYLRTYPKLFDMLREHQVLLSDLQHVHDRVMPSERSWNHHTPAQRRDCAVTVERKLEYIAQQYGLRFNRSLTAWDFDTPA